MEAWLSLSLEVRLAVLFVVGVLVGTQVNRGIYRLAWFPRRIGPWTPPDEKAPPRQWQDRLPIAGWWWLRRESSLHGAGFWVRPLLIELAMGLGFAALYAWEVRGGLAPAGSQGILAAAAGRVHAVYFAHLVLLTLMSVATFIDFDEKTIPDAITVPGTLIGLLLAALLPESLLPVVNARGLETLLLHSPQPWPLGGNRVESLGWAIACLGGWCLALLPRTWTLRRGWKKAFQYLLASMFRHRAWMIALGIFIVGAIGIAFVWQLDDARWRSLYTALVGMAFGGGLIWAVRIVGSNALGQEAMGFGDVTLMAMIGAFVGWQPSLLIFFLAPFAAVVISVVQWLTTGRKDIAFGPYLCAGTVILILKWPEIWDWGAGIFYLGWFIPALMAVCMVLMWGMLSLWRMVAH
ncbi:MAG: A24 family peptidase [Pirellulaceae bacterium]